MRREHLQRIREFVLEVDEATRTTRRGPEQRAQNARLARAYHRLSPDVQDMVADGYRLCLTACEQGGGHRVEAARYRVLANLIHGTALTREQILATPPEAASRATSDTAPRQPDDTTDIAEAAQVRTRRADSEPNSLPVATAVPMPDDVPRRPRTSGAGARSSRRRRLVALAAVAAMACLGYLAWSWHTAPPLERLVAPEPPQRELFPVNRVIEFEGGAMIISHGERDGDTTWLNAFELNFGDVPRPAVTPIVGPGIDGIDVHRRDIDVAKRVLDVSDSKSRIPPNSVRRRVIPVRSHNGQTHIELQLHREREDSIHAIPISQ